MSNSGGPRRWRVPVSGERPARRLAASQSLVLENTFGPGRCAIVADVSWTSGPTAEPRWLGQADRRKRASPPAGCFDGDIGARKPHAVNRRKELSEMAACTVAEGNLVRLEKDVLQKIDHRARREPFARRRDPASMAPGSTIPPAGGSPALAADRIGSGAEPGRRILPASRSGAAEDAPGRSTVPGLNI